MPPARTTNHSLQSSEPPASACKVISALGVTLQRKPAGCTGYFSEPRDTFPGQVGTPLPPGAPPPPSKRRRILQTAARGVATLRAHPKIPSALSQTSISHYLDQYRCAARPGLQLRPLPDSGAWGGGMPRIHRARGIFTRNAASRGVLPLGFGVPRSEFARIWLRAERSRSNVACRAVISLRLGGPRGDFPRIWRSAG